MSRASGKGKGDDGKVIIGEVEETSEDDDDDDDDDDREDEGSGREATPDLYRNSALGMCVPFLCMYHRALALIFVQVRWGDRRSVR